MDPEQLLWLEQFDEEEEEALDEMMMLANMTSALFIVGTNEEHAARADQRRQHRNYLRWAQLLLSPHCSTPWQALHKSHDDNAYIVTMGFNVQTFEYILESGFAE